MLTSCYQKAKFITLFVGGAEIKVRCVSLQDEIRADLDSKSVSDMSLDTISAVSNLSNASDSAGEQPSTPGGKQPDVSSNTSSFYTSVALYSCHLTLIRGHRCRVSTSAVV